MDDGRIMHRGTISRAIQLLFSILKAVLARLTTRVKSTADANAQTQQHYTVPYGAAKTRFPLPELTARQLG